MFKTNFDFEFPSLGNDLSNEYIFIGSCFGQHIGKKFEDHRLHSTINPTGICFNPHSLSEQLFYKKDNRHFIERYGVWHSLKHHSDMSAPTRERLISNIDSATAQLSNALENAHVLFVTFGTANIYTFQGEFVVSSCHQLPNQQFKKTLLSTAQIVELWASLITSLRSINPDLNIVFTLSPVRHIKDGMIQNQRSKAILLESIHQITEMNTLSYYFPAYELIMDDLRDYRFYNRDMIHPNRVAVDYVWEILCQKLFTENVNNFLYKMRAYLKASQHRPRFAFGEKYEAHMNHLKNSRNQLLMTFPHLINKL